MKVTLPHILFACMCAAPIGLNAADLVPAKNEADIAAIRQISIDMGDAMVAADIGTLDHIFADDWISVNSSGKTTTKATLLNDFKSFHDKLESYQLSPIDVQVYGNVAVAHGGVIEKRNRNGKDTSGQFVWMDLLEKRDGKWVVIQSAGRRVE